MICYLILRCLPYMRARRNNKQPTYPVLIEARSLVDRGEMPWEGYQALQAQVHSARRRQIPFLFTAEEWWAWWQIDDRWSRRGLKGNGLVMARKGDVGPYASWNVYPCTSSENVGAIDPVKRSLAIRAGWAKVRAAGGDCWLAGKRGDDHPRSRAVITPAGRFGSLALAAEHYGITRQAAYYRVARDKPGWYYDTPLPPDGGFQPLESFAILEKAGPDGTQPPGPGLERIRLAGTGKPWCPSDKGDSTSVPGYRQ
jgi:hypothetical protein